MAIKINFDSTHNAQSPTYILATRSGRKIGKLPAYNITFKDALNSYSEIFFRVNRVDCVSKDTDGKIFWDKIKDFKLMYCREYNRWFEIYVETDESNSLVKNITAKSLGEAELSQVNLYEIEINTETDISREDYEPTVLFDETNPEASLLNRIMEKAPHYKISHVDSSIASIQRTFTFDGISIYDAFQEIAKEIDCLFTVDVITDGEGKISRSVSVYDLESCCLECGKRDEFLGVCPECGSTNILTGYGKDTSIFVSTDNLADDIQYSTDVDSVKNCFKLVAGDDLMTATLVNCNPNGSGYIWYIPDETKEDMSDELITRLDEYDAKYNYYQTEYEIVVPGDLLTQYNDLIEKYTEYSSDLEKISESIIGYPTLMNAYYNTIDFYLFLNNELMPNVEMQDTTAAAEVSKLDAENLSPVAVQDINKVSSATASSSVLAMAKTIVDPRYQVKIGDSSLDGTTWTGNFTITNYSDEEDTAVSATVNIIINDNYEDFVKQKLDKALNQSRDEVTDIVTLFNLELTQFTNEIKKYSLSRLNSFYDACQSCLDILIEQGIADKKSWENQTPDLYSDIYVPYYNKLSAIADEIKVRESEIAIVVGTYDADGDLVSDGLQSVLERERDSIQEILDFEAFLGEELWLEFVAYRREDTYQNDNYISDGLNNAELFDRALEFIETAKKDIFKSATLQHSITATLKNLLVMKEFTPIVDYFEVGNWIRVRIDNNIYRLRIIDFEIDYDNLLNLAITFSDVKSGATGVSDAESIMNQAASMSSSYGAVSRQASQGNKSNQQLNDWVNNGLALTKMKIVDSADNQNITFDTHGLLGREYLPITDTYDDKQLKLINRGIYLTNDNWLTSSVGVGDFVFYNPKTGKMEEDYGVIAKTLVGNLILSEEVGVYTANGSITMDDNGLTITTSGEQDLGKVFEIRRLEENGEYTGLMYVDSDGNLAINGNARIDNDGQSTTINGIVEKYSDLEVRIDGISASVSETVTTEVHEAVSNLEIGGTQLLPNTKTMAGYALFEGITLSEDAEGFTVATYAANEPLESKCVEVRDPIQFSIVRGKTVTFSLEVRSDDYEAINAESNQGLRIILGLCSADSTSRTLYGRKNFYTTPLSDNWQKITWTVTLADDFFAYGSGTIGETDRLKVQVYKYTLYSMEARKFKLEIGSTSTDWSPAPSDVDGDINDLRNSVTINTEKIAELEVKSDEISLSVSETKETIENFEIGGRNLLPDTKRMTGYIFKYVGIGNNPTYKDDDGGFRYVQWPATSSNGSENTYSSNPPISFSSIRGQTVTFSFLVRSDSYESINAYANYGLLVYFNLCTGESTDQVFYKKITSYDFALSADWQKISYTVTLTDDIFTDATTDGTGVIDDATRLFVTIGNNCSKYSLEIKKMQLELGNVATDWTPSPDDQEAASSKAQSTADAAQDAVDSLTSTVEQEISRLDIKADGITSEVSKQTTRVDQMEESMTTLRQTADSFSIEIQTIKENGVDKLTNEFGLTIDGTCVNIHRTGSEMSNSLDETGMYIIRSKGTDNETTMLKANADGVEATNLLAKSCLKFANSRLESYGAGRTACFYAKEET